MVLVPLLYMAPPFAIPSFDTALLPEILVSLLIVRLLALNTAPPSEFPVPVAWEVLEFISPPVIVVFPLL